jgi:hypothetical protein
MLNLNQCSRFSDKIRTPYFRNKDSCVTTVSPVSDERYNSYWIKCLSLLENGRISFSHSGANIASIRLWQFSTVFILVVLQITGWHLSLQLLLHHVIPGAFEMSSLQDEMTGVSLAGTQLRVNTYTTQDVEWNDVKVRPHYTLLQGSKKHLPNLRRLLTGLFWVSNIIPTTVRFSIVNWGVGVVQKTQRKPPIRTNGDGRSRWICMGYVKHDLHVSFCLLRSMQFFSISCGGWDWVHLVIQPLFGLLYQPLMIDDDECGAVVGMRIGRGNRSTRRKHALVPLCAPQFPHHLTWDRPWPLRCETAWAMARPNHVVR